MELISGVTPDVILMLGFSLWFPDTADSSGNDFAHAPPAQGTFHFGLCNFMRSGTWTQSVHITSN